MYTFQKYYCKTRAKFTFRFSEKNSGNTIVGNLFMFVARDSADEQATVVDRQTGAHEAPTAYLKVVELARRSLGVATSRVGGEAVSSVGAVVVEHQSQFV